MEFLSKEHIILNKNGLGTKKEIIEMISQKAIELGISNNKEELLQSFIEREDLGTTGFGDGLAIPHAKCKYVNEVAIIIVKSDTPIEWESIDNNPVYIAISLLVPEDNPDNIHLKVLSAISRKLVNQTFKNAIFQSKNEDELLSLFESVIIEK